MLRSVVCALAVMPLALACTSARSSGPENRARLTNDGVPFLPANVMLYVPDALSVRPGQAVRYEADAGEADRDPVFLDASCITGTPLTTFDVADGGTRPGAQLIVGRSADGSPSLTDEALAVRARGEAVDRFRADTAPAVTRVVGAAAAFAMGNDFRLRDARRERSGPECGTHYVKSVQAARYLTYAVTIDFPSLASAYDFKAAGGDINVILEAEPEVATLLKERGAKITLRVVASKGLAAHVGEKLREADCSVDNLAGCAVAHRALMNVIVDFDRLPGDDSSLEAVAEAVSTWSLHGAAIAEASEVP